MVPRNTTQLRKSNICSTEPEPKSPQIPQELHDFMLFRSCGEVKTCPRYCRTFPRITWLHSIPAICSGYYHFMNYILHLKAMICKISTSKTPRSCKILKNLSKTLTFCSFLCSGSFLGFSRFLDFFSLQRLGWALSGQHHKKLTRRVLCSTRKAGVLKPLENSKTMYNVRHRYFRTSKDATSSAFPVDDRGSNCSCEIGSLMSTSASPHR